MATVGRNLSGAVTSYNRAVGSLEGRVLVTARRFVELGVVGRAERSRTRPSPVDTVTGPLRPPSCGGRRTRRLRAPRPGRRGRPAADLIGPVGAGARPRGRHYRPLDAESQPQTSSPAAARGLGQSVLVAIAAAVTVVLVAGYPYRDPHPVARATAGHHGRLRSPWPTAWVRPRRPPVSVGVADGRRAHRSRHRRSRTRPGASSSRDSTWRCGRRRTQAVQAQNLASPPPEGDLASQFTQVMDLRATATSALRARRSTGSSACSRCPSPAHRRPPPARPGHADLGRPGRLRDDGRGTDRSSRPTPVFRAVRAARPHPRDPPPAALGVGAGAGRHRAARQRRARGHGRRPGLVASARGLPPAGRHGGGARPARRPVAAAWVPRRPRASHPDLDRAAGASPAVVPPTGTLGTLVTVTNCGTVPESGVKVSVTVARRRRPRLGAAAGGAPGWPEPSRVVAVASGCLDGPPTSAHFPSPPGTGTR